MSEATEQTADLTLVLDCKLRVLMSSDAARAWIGERTLDEALGESPTVREALASALGGATVELEAALPGFADGHLRVRVEPLVEGDGGAVVGATLLATSTSQQRRAARAEALAERLRVVLAAEGLVAWEWEVPGDHFHRDGGEHFGPSPTDLSSFLSVVHEDDRPDVARALRESLESDAPYHVVYRKAVHGELRWFEATADVVRGEGGHVARLVGATADITARRHLEEQLRQAQKMEAVGRLAGGVAHGFNNLLTTIVACTELLRAHLQADPIATRDLDAIAGATRRATALTRQLLTISRGQPLRPALLDMNEVASEILRMATRTLGEDIELRCETAAEPLTVRADAGQIHELLLNLLVNAREAMPDGGTLTIATSRQVLGASNPLSLPAGPYTRMAVTDTGIGMDDATRARLFEPFFTTKPTGQGTGLGLATVHAVATQLGGTATVDSRPGEGATFSILLPLQAPPIAPAPRAESERAKGRGVKACILLVEDDDAVRRVARRLLESGGHVVIEATDGEHALRVVREHGTAVDLVLTDVVMPKMGGMQLAQRLWEGVPDLPIVFTSGYTEDDVLHRGVQAGQVTFVRKPYTAETLLEAVASKLPRT